MTWLGRFNIRGFDNDQNLSRQGREVTCDTSRLQRKPPVWVPRQMTSLWSNHLSAISSRCNKIYYPCYDQNNRWFGAERSVEARLKYVF